VKKDIRNVSYNKRVTNKIRSVRSPLIMGRREIADFEGFEWKLDWGFGNSIFGPSSEKGSSRKYTKNWVTSWGFLFWGNFGILR
jgi:hypothetical protein